MFVKLNRELFRAITRNDEEEVARLISKGANPNKIMQHHHAQDLIKHHLASKDIAKEGCTPLLLATYKGYTGIMQILILAGAHPNYLSAIGTPLEMAVKKGNTQAIEVLCQAGATPPFTGLNYKLTPAYCAYQDYQAQIKNNYNHLSEDMTRAVEQSKAEFARQQGLFSSRNKTSQGKIV